MQGLGIFSFPDIFETMRHSLHSHIIYLENKIQSLKDCLTSPRITSDEIQELEVQISVAELAVTRYREAYALEISVSNPEPPHSPETKSNDSDSAEKSSERKTKKNGLFATSLRAKKKVPMRIVRGHAASALAVSVRRRSLGNASAATMLCAGWRAAHAAMVRTWA